MATPGWPHTVGLTIGDVVASDTSITATIVTPYALPGLTLADPVISIGVGFWLTEMTGRAL